MTVNDEGDKYRAPALDKGLDILELLSRRDDAMSQVEIAKSLNRSANEIYRMLDRLVRRNYVRRTNTDRYELTLKLFELAHERPPMTRLVSQALPAMRRFVQAAGQPCHLGVLDRDVVVVIAQVDAPSYWNVSLRIGARVPLATSSSGHVHLAFLSPEERALTLAEQGRRRGYGREIEARLAEVRRNGYDCQPSGYIAGVTNVSAPIFGPLGGVIASLTCPFMKRIDREDAPGLETVIQLMVATARELSRRELGTPAS